MITPFLLGSPVSVADWVTPAGALTANAVATGGGVNLPLLALSRRGRRVTYSVVAGQLPPGLSLNASTGKIAGVISANATANVTVFGFTIAASD